MFLATYVRMSIQKKNISDTPTLKRICQDASVSLMTPTGASVVDAVKQTASPTAAAAASDVNVVVIVVVVAEETTSKFQLNRRRRQ
jgi:hypothetical protein